LSGSNHRGAHSAGIVQEFGVKTGSGTGEPEKLVAAYDPWQENSRNSICRSLSERNRQTSQPYGNVELNIS
jgi:hypothetical protein